MKKLVTPLQHYRVVPAGYNPLVHRGVNFNAHSDDMARFIYRQGEAALRARGYPANMTRLERQIGDGTWIEIRLSD